MSDVILNDVTNVNQLSVINDNFDKIEDHLNLKAIDRTNVGSLADDVDMNGNRIYNLPTPVLDNEPARLRDLRDAVITAGGSLSDVSSFNTRIGDIVLTDTDVVNALTFNPAPRVSPVFLGIPIANTPDPSDNSSQLATTAFVQSVVASGITGVSSFNTRTGAVTLSSGDITTALTYTPANLVSPTFTGVPAVPTAAPGTNTTQAASTAFVTNAVAASTTGVSSFNARTGAVTLTSGDVTGALTYTPANLVSPTFTGVPSGPTAAPGTNTTQFASTAFVTNAVSAISTGVSSFNTRTGAVTLASVDVTTALSYTPANLISPVFTGTPLVPTATPGTNSTQAASTAFVQSAVSGLSVNLANVSAALESGKPSLDYVQSSPWSGVNNQNSVTITREANYTGGGVDTYGNRCVGSALTLFTRAGANASNCEMTFQAVIESNSNIAVGAAPLPYLWPQNLAISGIAYQVGTAPVWAGWLTAQNTSGVPQSGSRGALVGLEINIGITGTDNYASSIGIDLVPQAMATGACSAYAAVRASGDVNQTWQYGFVATQATQAAFMSSANGIYGLQLTGSLGVAINMQGGNSNGLLAISGSNAMWLSGPHGGAVGGIRIYIDGAPFIIPIHSV